MKLRHRRKIKLATFGASFCSWVVIIYILQTFGDFKGIQFLGVIPFSQVQTSCSCPSFGLSENLMQEWLMTKAISRHHLDFKNIRNLPKSRVPVSLNFLRLKIIKHKLYVSGLKFKHIAGRNISVGVTTTYLHFVSLFLNVLVNTKYGDIPDIELLINAGACGTDINPGVMTHSRNEGPALLPSDYETMCTNGADYTDISKSGAWPSIMQVPYLPWKYKKNKAVWRGSCTGTFKNEYFKHVRFRVAEEGNSNHDVLDTKLIRNGPCKNNMGAQQKRVNDMFAKQDLLKRQYLNFEKVLGYKLTIDANGDCENSQRFSKLLLGRTLVLKSSGHSSTFLTRLMKPWEHYVPFNRNADDLATLSRDLLSKPEHAENMVERAVLKVSEVLSPRGMVCYVRELINAYSKLLTFAPEVSSTDVLITALSSHSYINSTIIPLRGWPKQNFSNYYSTSCEIKKVQNLC